MERRPIFGANWKMNKNLDEALEYAVEFRRLMSQERKVDVVLVPSFPYLATLVKKFEESPVAIGAQNCHEAEKGAFTGEVSVDALKSVGVEWVVLGHSERRHVFGESDERIANKVFHVLQNGLKPIFCVGEKLEQREAGKTMDVIKQQVDGGLSRVRREDMEHVVIAYEPVWAIGTGKTATPAQAQEVHAAIRGLLAEKFGSQVADATRIQYGGSVKPANVKALMDQPDVDGGLVGGASLDPRSFTQIVQYYRN